MEADLTENDLAVLYDDWRAPLARALAIRFHLSPEEAEDATQEAFLRTCEALAHGARIDTAHARGWVYRVARNHVFDGLRRRKLLTFVPLASLPETPAAADLVEQVADRLEAEETLAALSWRERRLLLALAAGYSGAELTAQTGYGGVKMTIWRARQYARRLRERGAA